MKYTKGTPKTPGIYLVKHTERSFPVLAAYLKGEWMEWRRTGPQEFSVPFEVNYYVLVEKFNVMAEPCENCKYEAEETGIEYKPSFTWAEEVEQWVCDWCGMPVDQHMERECRK